MAASLPPPPPPEAPEQLPAHLAPEDVATAIRVLDACVALDVEAYESSKALRPCAAPWAPRGAGLGRTFDGSGAADGSAKAAARKAHKRAANRARQQAVAAEKKAADALCDLLPGGLGVLVNNACQTVPRPPQYYEPLLRRELDLRNALAGGEATKLLTSEAAGHARAFAAPASAVALRDVDRGDPARRSQLCVLPGDERRDDAAFPAAATDANSDLGQQLDLRRTNSWTLKLEHVSTPELAEVFAINALAPFVLNSKLKALLAKPELSFVVNVSAMEGKFYRRKQPTHPHTNMAKAALNMLTKTSAGDYADCGIYMTAVDTGWVNDEKPAHLAAAHAADHGRAPSRVDARHPAPVLALNGVRPGEPARAAFGVFLADYGVQVHGAAEPQRRREARRAAEGEDPGLVELELAALEREPAAN
ncbi:short chain dehydrogenase [Aureococcus anophagefferens]|nr:short chain dehydrogenase [Aureococcus anophagefferens]